MHEANRIYERSNDRLLDLVKAGATAVTILNTGSWLGLLSQADKLAAPPVTADIASPILAWGLGALLGTAIWLFAYLNEHAIAAMQMDPANNWSAYVWWSTFILGLTCAVLSLGLFGHGVLSLAAALR